MARSLVDFSGASVAAGNTVVPEDFNEISEAAEIFVEAWKREHRASDDEHGSLLVPTAAGIFTQVAGAYTLANGENFNSAVVDNGVGDLTLKLDLEMRSAEDWFVDIAPGPVTEPVFAVEYDDGGGLTRTTKLRRIRLFLQDGTLTDRDFIASAYGPRAFGAAGLGTSVPAAVADVRNRICSDGVESAEHRTKLLEFLEAKRQQLARKHHVQGPETGKHKDIQIPIATALLRSTGDLRTGGELVWKEGAWDGSPAWTSSGDSNASLIQQRVDFAVASGYRWTGVRVCPVFDGTLGNPVGRYAVPRICREYGVIDRWDRRCKVDLGGYAAGKLANLTQLGLVVMGYRPEWQE